MSILIKAGTGLVAGIVAGALGLAFLPRIEPYGLKPRSAVEKPQFVAAPEASPAVAPSAPRAAAAIAVAEETPEAKPSVEASRPAAAPVAQAKPEPAKAADVATAKPETAKVSPTPSPIAEARAAATTTPKSTASEASARWSVRGLVAFAKGDLSSARLFLTRAADEGDPRAFVALAETYDPAMLTKLGVVGAPGDLQRAKDYLAKAAAAGVVVAKDRMAAIDQDSHEVH